MHYTKLQTEIIHKIYEGGKNDVELSAISVGQNGNFYHRINRLKNNGLITFQKREGLSSLYTLTQEGINYYFQSKNCED